MKVKLNGVRIAYTESLWEAKEFKEGDGKPRHSVTVLIEPGSANDKAMETAIKCVAVEGFGAKAEAMLKSFRGNPQKFCYQDGDTKAYDGFAGMKYAAAHRRAKDGKPRIVDTDGKTPIEQADGKIYGGCYANVVVDLYAQVRDNPGIRCSLLGVQFARDGDAFSGSRLGEDEFDDLTAGEEDPLFG